MRALDVGASSANNRAIQPRWAPASSRGDARQCLADALAEVLAGLRPTVAGT